METDTLTPDDHIHAVGAYMNFYNALIIAGKHL